MRIPEFLFPLINRMMKVLLNSSLHRMMSSSLLVVYFTGRKTGRARSTPLRYLRDGNQVTCMTGRQVSWWHNFKSPAEVQLQLAGERVTATGEATVDDAQAIEAALHEVLRRHPGDAPYHGLSRSPTEEEWEAAVANDVLVTFTLKQ